MGVGRFWYPKHVYDRFHTAFVTPYLQGAFTPERKKDEVLVTDAVTQFVNRPDLADSTRHSYTGVLNLFVDSLVDRGMFVNELKQEDILSFLDRPSLESQSSRASYARQLNAFLNWTVRERILHDTTLTVQVPRATAGRLGRKLFLSPEEFLDVKKSVLKAARKEPKKRQEWGYVSWTIDVFDLAIATGLRLEELVQLQWQDINMGRGVLEVRPKTAQHDGFAFMPKGKRARFVELRRVARGNCTPRPSQNRT